jgi:hypothetical protein
MTVSVLGVLKGNTITLDVPIPSLDGQRVTVIISMRSVCPVTDRIAAGQYTGERWGAHEVGESSTRRKTLAASCS